jgi:hypothetical protein
MSQLQLIDATVLLRQAQAVLSMWLESTTKTLAPTFRVLSVQSSLCCMASGQWEKPKASWLTM